MNSSANNCNSPSLNGPSSYPCHRLYVFFPVDAVTGHHCLLYGRKKIYHNDPHCHAVYITCLHQKGQLCLLGAFNTGEPKPVSQSVWIQLKAESNCIRIVSAEVDQIQISLREIVLVLYDKSVVKSEVLRKNPNWESSQCLRELGDLLSESGLLANWDETNSTSSVQPVSTLGSIGQLSKVLLQLQQRVIQFKVWRRSQSEMVLKNLVLMVIVDLLLGFGFLQLFHSIGGTGRMLETFLSSVKVIADSLQILIEWLMGVPVGLKLNQPLSTVLGKFFLYHLYLWKTYIDIIRPVLSFIIWVSSTLGLAGLSFQLALLADLVTLASLHCYCFYIYAARLYGVALSGLRSTFRMFSGRKWNPLRLRVDTGHFGWDQLCVGMLIFSTLLFLLPTILVYYIVFLALRLGVLTVQGTIRRLIWLINVFPIYSLLLWIINSPSLAGDVMLELVPCETTSSRHLTLRLSWIKLPLKESLQLSRNPATSDYPNFKWAQRFAEVFSGQLIYPL